MKYTVALISIVSFLAIENARAQLPNYIFRGGAGDGHDMITLGTNSDFMSNGGDERSESVDSITGINIGLHRGAAQVATIPEIAIGENVGLHRGADGDGHDLLLYREPFIWTGAVGTGWPVAGNWNYNLIPGINRDVIIPEDVPFYPFVSAGLFTIGDNPNGGQYRCNSLTIDEGALLVTRINNRIENYGLITINGTMQVKRTNANAFQNLNGGTVIVKSTGSLLIKP